MKTCPFCVRLLAMVPIYQFIFLFAVTCGVAYWRPWNAIVNRRWLMRLSQLTAYGEILNDQPKEWIFAPDQPTAIDLLGSEFAKLGIDRECRGWFESTEMGVRGVATDCKFRFKFGKRSQVWMQTILEVKFPGEQLPHFVAHPRTILLPCLGTYETVRTETHLDLTHQFESLFPNEVSKLFAFAGCDIPELVMFGTRPWSIECDRDRILIYQLRQLVPPHRISEFIRDGIRLSIAFLSLKRLQREALEIEI